MRRGGEEVAFRHFVPAGVVAVQGFGEHQHRPGAAREVAGTVFDLHFLPLGVEERRRAIVRRVADGVEGLAVGHAGRQAKRFGHAVGLHRAFDISNGAAIGVRRVGKQAIAEQQQEDDFAVGGANAVVVKVRGDAEFQIAPHLIVPTNATVMHEQPVAVAEGVAVLPRRRGASRGADVGEKQPRFDLFGKAAKVVVVPGGANVAVEAGLVLRAVPTHAEPVAIGRNAAALAGERLVDQRVLRFKQQRVKTQRGPCIGKPTAHDRSRTWAVQTSPQGEGSQRPF